MQNITIGVDISNKTLDICVKKTDKISYYEIENSVTSIKNFFQLYVGFSLTIGMENTGRYNWYLYRVLASYDFDVYVINPLHFSKSQGLVRGKDDQVDAYRIATFTEKHRQELTQWRPCSKVIEELKLLLSERHSRIQSKKRLKTQCHDYKKMESSSLSNRLKAWNQQQIRQLDQQIKKLELLIQEVIRQDAKLDEQHQLIQSVPGVGKIVSWYFLSKTEGFDKINEPRKMACYSGVAPFKYQSGTSIYRKPTVSAYADKQMKSLLHLAAMSAIKSENDLKIYYERKVSEGKSKMSVINAIRNKIIHIIFAIIKSGNLYENRLVYS